MLAVFLFTLVYMSLCWLTYVPKPKCADTPATPLPETALDNSLAKVEVAEVPEPAIDPIAPPTPKPIPKTKALTKANLKERLKEKGRWQPEYLKLTKVQLQKIEAEV